MPSMIVVAEARRTQGKRSNIRSACMSVSQFVPAIVNVSTRSLVQQFARFYVGRSVRLSVGLPDPHAML